MLKNVNIGDVTLHVVDQGEGTPLLLVHGFPLSHAMWQAQIDAFSTHCRVIAPDLRGFGRSGVTSGTVTMEQYADDLNALLDRLEITEPVAFVGLSMEGYIAWQFWRKYAARVGLLAVCDTRAVADTVEVAAGRGQLAAKVLSAGPAAAADAMMPRLLGMQTVKEQPEVVRRLREIILANSPEGIAAALRGMAVRPDVTGMLPKITAPTLVVVGEHDVISTVEEMRGIADQLDDAAWVVIPGVGHMTPMENPAVFNDALTSFLTR